MSDRGTGGSKPVPVEFPSEPGGKEGGRGGGKEGKAVASVHGLF